MTADLDVARARFQSCVESRDAVSVLDVLDEDYALVLVQPASAVMPRARWLDVLADYVVHEHVEEAEHVDVDGDLATVLHRVRMRATVLGEDRSGTFVLTDVWRRREGAWRLWRRHSTPLSAGDMPGA
jgi:ketosteroid isomerase-like protein